MTLIELLIAMVISVLIVSVVGAALIASLEINKSTREQLAESHDSQLVAAYLPGDLLSAGMGAVDDDPASPTGCASTPTERLNVAVLRWQEAEPAGTRNFVAAYRVRNESGEWQLVRYACDAVGSTATTPAAIQIVARNLAPVVTDADLPDVIVAGSLVTLTIRDASGYTFTISGTRRVVAAASAAAAAAPSPSASPSPPPVRAAATRVELLGTATGDVRIEVEFSLPLEADCVTAFTLAGLDGRGTYSGTAALTSGNQIATLSIDKGTFAPNTAAGALRVSLAGETSSCTAASVDAAEPADLAPPVLLALVANNRDGGTLRRLEDGDRLQLQFSEPVSNLPSPIGARLEGGNSATTSDRLAVPGVTQAATPLNRTDYVLGNRSGTALGTPVRTDNTYTAPLTITTCGPQGNCGDADDFSAAAATAAYTYTQVATLADAAGNTMSNRGLAPPTVTVPNFGAF